MAEPLHNPLAMTRDRQRRLSSPHAADHRAPATAPGPGRSTLAQTLEPGGAPGPAALAVSARSGRGTSLGAALDAQLQTLVAHLRHGAGSCADASQREPTLAAIDTRIEAAFRHVPDEQHEAFRAAVMHELDDATLDALDGAVAQATGRNGASARSRLQLGGASASGPMAAPRGGSAATSHPTQLDVGTADRDDASVAAIARAGVARSGGALPHLDTVQRAFGHHDVRAVQAHVGGPAAEAASAIGARAYAVGDAVAFAGSPDLHTAAHEAAHVVQQRGGVRLAGGVGRAGDPYERHADAVADAVVRGDSAQALLDTMAHRGASGGSAVQLLTELADAEAASRLHSLIHSARTDADLQTIRTALRDALAHPAAMRVRVGVDMVLVGEHYRLELSVADARRLAVEAAAARPAAPDGDAALLAGLGPRAEEAHPIGVAAEGRREFLDTGSIDTHGIGSVRLRGAVTGALDAVVVPEEPHGVVSGVETSVTGGRTTTHAGHAEWSGAETGLLRDWLLPRCHGFADHLGVAIAGDHIELTAGGETGTVHLGPFDFRLSIDLIEVDLHGATPGQPRRRPSITPPSVTLHSEVAVSQLASVLPAALVARAGHSRVGLDLQWVPPWQQILRNLALAGADDAALAAAAPVVSAEVYGTSIATGGASTASIAAAAALPVLAGVLIVGGTMVAMAAAQEDGAHQGLLTWYVREYAATFADACFHQHAGHASDERGVPGASHYAGQGRSDARASIHDRLTPDQRDALRLHYRTHEALAQAVGRILAERLALDLFDPYALR